MHRVPGWVSVKYLADPFVVRHTFSGWSGGEIGCDQSVEKRRVGEVEFREFFV
jgi:hypothetical protein